MTASPELKMNNSIARFSGIERGNALKAQKSERENRLRQYGANSVFVKPLSSAEGREQQMTIGPLLSENTVNLKAASTA